MKKQGKKSQLNDDKEAKLQAIGFAWVAPGYVPPSRKKRKVDDEDEEEDEEDAPPEQPDEHHYLNMNPYHSPLFADPQSHRKWFVWHLHGKAKYGKVRAATTLFPLRHHFNVELDWKPCFWLGLNTKGTRSPFCFLLTEIEKFIHPILIFISRCFASSKHTLRKNNALHLQAFWTLRVDGIKNATLYGFNLHWLASTC